jgi:hypothetical protein
MHDDWDLIVVIDEGPRYVLEDPSEDDDDPEA